MPTFLRDELLAEGLVEARYLGLEGGGVEGFVDGSVEYTFHFVDDAHVMSPGYIEDDLEYFSILLKNWSISSLTFIAALIWLERYRSTNSANGYVSAT